MTGGMWNPCYGYVGCEPSKEGLCIIPEYRKVFVNRGKLFFPGREFDLLHTFVSCSGRVFTYEQLFYKVWKEEGDFAESIMHSCIKRIRRRLETDMQAAAASKCLVLLPGTLPIRWDKISF